MTRTYPTASTSSPAAVMETSLLKNDRSPRFCHSSSSMLMERLIDIKNLSFSHASPCPHLRLVCCDLLLRRCGGRFHPPGPALHQRLALSAIRCAGRSGAVL